ncbi:MAG: hypothetical protein R2802_06645 [Flavobacteriaceae bacterium]|nr:hypothetical protein [Mangrovimonas sp.]MCB0469445.1 hypothetical protein [Flavobacteriaceae bacterium]MCB0425790.1 hypothetical protein [Mangrovimonas sp.]MCB0432146.1 hypothetical protein [Mangrovimonas sp.]MCB0435340.1 hypothetical protein [Mangrovimonas sp.]
MKALKITLFVVVLSALFTSCVKEDLNDDDQLLSPQDQTIQVSYDTGGNTGEQ